MFAPFQVGDIVRLKRGTGSPIHVDKVDYFQDPPRYRYENKNRDDLRFTWWITYSYVSSRLYDSTPSTRWRRAIDFELVNGKEQPVTTKLYQTIAQPSRYGTLLAKNSQGMLVLEMKGTGDVEAFSPKDVMEVMPYTVRIQRFQGGERDGEIRNYIMDEGDVKKGDVLCQLSNGNLWKVIDIDTKERSPNESKNGFLKLEGKIVG